MRPLFEPLLEGLYQLARCPVILLDKDEHVLFRQIPRGGDDILRYPTRVLKQLKQRIKSSATPVLLTTEKDVGGYLFPDSSLLLVGPMDCGAEPYQFDDLIEESDAPEAVPANDGTKAVPLLQKSPDGQDDTGTGIQDRTEARADTTEACLPTAEVIRKGTELSEGHAASFYGAMLKMQRKAVNVQLEAIAWSARRLIPESLPLDKDFDPDVLNELTSCKELKGILPEWMEVIREERPHSSYLFELQALDAITQGDPQGYVLAFNRNRNGQNGTLAYTKLRDAQNLAICGIVLNARAAIAGGLSVEQAYTMADYLILSVENCHFPHEADLINFKNGLIFARMVQGIKLKLEQKKAPRFLSQQALELIRRFLYTKVTRKQIAAELKVNEDYLDRVLKDDFNTTVTECLRHERIDEAKRLLVQTNTPVGEIAAMLLFAQPSHFIRVFRQYTGVTPADYRKRKLTLGAMAHM